MSELLTFSAGVAVLAATALAFYMGGREKAERKAWHTISTLRREIRVIRMDNDRLRERINGLPKGDAYRARNSGGQW